MTVNILAACPFTLNDDTNELSDRNIDLRWFSGSQDVADSETTTPHNCKCTTICSCGASCDVGTGLGETRDWCNTGSVKWFLNHPDN